jgi:hypothetical protein
MKKQILYYLISCLILLVTSCEKDRKIYPLFFVKFDGLIGQSDNSTLITDDGNITICGSRDTGTALRIIKVSESGNLMLQKDIVIKDFNHINGIVEMDDYLFICGSAGYVNRSSDVILVKTKNNGDTMWVKNYGGKKYDCGYNIIKTKDHKLLICGIYSISDVTGNIYLIKVNSNGDTIWTKKYNETANESPAHLLETQNGDYLITGSSDNVNSGIQIYFLKVDRNGNKIWDKRIGPANRRGGSTIELSNGDLVTCGNQYETGGTSQILLFKTDNMGNKIWESEFGLDDFNEGGSSMKSNLDGTFTITGSSYSPYSGQHQIILVKADKEGTLIWFKRWEKSGSSEWAANIVKSANDCNIITGTMDSPYYSRSIFVIRTDSSGNYN